MGRPAKPRTLSEHHDSLARVYKRVSEDQDNIPDKDKAAILKHVAEALNILQRTMVRR